jgi:two-component system, OmpR family, KDP operon response regulator KdpE
LSQTIRAVFFDAGPRGGRKPPNSKWASICTSPATTVEVTVLKPLGSKVGAPHVGGETKPSNGAIRCATPRPANKVLVIGCEPQIRRFVGAGLNLHGYSVCQVENGSAGLNAVVHIRPDLIILDADLLDMSGIEVLETIRSWSNVPVIVLSIQTEEDYKVLLLRGGADDYLIKPFGIAELAARCEAMLRRYHTAFDKDPAVQTGPLTIDLVSRAVTLNGQHVTLTRKEYALLHLLASHLGSVMTHNQLIKDFGATPGPTTTSGTYEP